MKKTYLITALIALLVSSATFGIFFWFNQKGQTIQVEHLNTSPPAQPVYTLNDEGEYVPLDFTRTAENVMDAVVFIRSTQTVSGNNRNPQYNIPDPFREFFDDSPFFRSPQQPRQPQLRVGQGSGVIIQEDGFIVTNNHVIANAEDLEVTLTDNRTYKATVVGTDPSTDLALIRIQEKGLPTLPYVDSDEVRIGEWVLAVGNPFNLTSTVTAGIVSAKARSINILRERFAVESFIQTDAAINPGNSGGALVNLNGKLVGINTAIASQTGSYAGYGFAVPSNIVEKVVDDLIKYGVVQRGVLGVMIRTVDGNLQKEKDLSITQGAYVDSLLENSAAGEAGVRPGDVITAVDDNPVIGSSTLQELIARRRPGDEVAVTVNRDGKLKTFEVILSNRSGGRELVEKEQPEVLTVLGAEFETLDAETARKLDIDGGVQVKQLFAGKLRRNTQMREGFIITKVDGKAIRSVEDLVAALEGKQGGVMLEGIYENLPGTQYYAFGM